jgi:hypothetical protein
MFPYKEEHFNYSDALDLKHPKTKSAAAEHNAKQSKLLCYNKQKNNL